MSVQSQAPAVLPRGNILLYLLKITGLHYSLGFIPLVMKLSFIHTNPCTFSYNYVSVF